MTRIFFIVKGNRRIAVSQCRSRGISFEIAAESENCNETYCYAPIVDHPKIIDWYCGDAGVARAPQTGDCLWFAERE